MKTVLIAQLKHETNTYISERVGIEEFKDITFVTGEEIIPYFRGAKTEVGGFLSVLEKEPEIKLLPVVAAEAVPAGIVKDSVWDTVMNELLKALDKNRVDGILFAFHGAMVAESHEDAEGDMLEVLRKTVGDEVPICITFDYHANITEKIVDNSTLIFPYDNYPHTDIYDRGVEAAENMLKILNGSIKPVKRWKKLKLLFPLTVTRAEPYKSFLDKAFEYEKRPDVVSVSVVSGFVYADIYESGACVLAQTNGDEDLADSIVNDMSNMIWNNRQKLYKKIHGIKEAVEIAMNSKGPVVLADVSDNPGSGFGGDSTMLIQELIDRGAKNCVVGVLCDPQTVRQACGAGVGSTIRVSLGGKSTDKAGPPIIADAHVKLISDGNFISKGIFYTGLPTTIGISAVLVIGGVTILVSSLRQQPFAPDVFRAHGIEPTEAQIIVVKSAAHFRAGFTSIAEKIIDVDAPNICPQDITKLEVKKTQRPIYPIDNI